MTDKNELKKQILFDDLSDGQLDFLMRIITETSYKKDDVIFKEGDDTRGIYLIVSGRIEIYKTRQKGLKQTLAMFSAGHFMGELSVIEKRRHEAVAVASEDSKVLLLSKDDFYKLEKENPDLAMRILKKIAIILSRNLRRMNDKYLNVLSDYK